MENKTLENLTRAFKFSVVAVSAYYLSGCGAALIPAVAMSATAREAYCSRKHGTDDGPYAVCKGTILKNR